MIADLTTAGVPPREFRTYIRQTSSALTTQQDVYNLAASTRQKLAQGQSSIQALVNQLNDEGFWSRVQLDAANRLTAIFFAHPDSVTYLQQNPDILILDCTYKTNKYGLPLLDMIGVDCCQRSFCIAFAFLASEIEEQYMWALIALSGCTPVHHFNRPLRGSNECCRQVVFNVEKFALSLACQQSGGTPLPALFWSKKRTSNAGRGKFVERVLRGMARDCCV
jgi:hypothetical protein